MKTITAPILIGICTAFTAAPVLAQMQESAVEYYTRLHSGTDEYYFFEDDRKQVVDYNEERIVRICTGDNRHLVPLEVTHDGTTSIVRANDCLRVEAKSVALEPAEQLPPNYVIKADVETIS